MKSIILRDHEVRAILDGRKTMLRRPVKCAFVPDIVEVASSVQGPDGEFYESNDGGPIFVAKKDQRSAMLRNPFGVVGDSLWVRECFGIVNDYPDPDPFAVMYRAGGKRMRVPSAHQSDAWTISDGHGEDWRSSSTMPRWASRLSLRVADVRVERDGSGPWEWVVDAEAIR